MVRVHSALYLQVIIFQSRIEWEIVFCMFVHAPECCCCLMWMVGWQTLRTYHMDHASPHPPRHYKYPTIHIRHIIMHPVYIHLKSTCSCPICWESDYCYQAIIELLASGATLGLDDDYTEYEHTVSNNASTLDQSNIQHEGLDIIYDSTKQNCNTTTTQIHNNRICKTASNKRTTRRSKPHVKHAPQHSGSSRTHDTTCIEQTSTSNLPNKHLQPSTSTSDTLPSNSNSPTHSSNYNIPRTNRRKRVGGNDNTGPTNITVSHSASKTTKRTTMRVVLKAMSNFFLHANWEQQTKESTLVGGTSCCVNHECLVTSIACIT
jgi:hypothetical protein